MNTVFDGGHICSVEKQTSDSFLPPLSKEANYCQRFVRNYKKFIQVSKKVPRTQEYFRSSTGFSNERKRHAHSRYSYVIHPFSNFAFCRELILSFALAETFICAPLIVTFHKQGICGVFWIYLLEFLTTVIFILDVIVRFFMGIENNETKEVILEQPKIIRKYTLSINFTLDVITAFSFCTINYIYNLDWHQYLTCLRLLKIFRLSNFLKYFSQFAHRWGFPVVAKELAKYLIMTVILLHWFTCLLHLIAEFNGHTGLNPSSHLMSSMYLPSLYLECVFEAMGILFCARTSWDGNCSIAEIILIIVTLILGRIYMLVLTVSTLNQVLNQWSLETKYLGILDQLNEFMRYKKLPLTLRQRMQDHFEYKYQHKYFRETLITSILSDKLKREINIQVCKRLVQQASFLADLPTKVLGDVLTHLKSEVFLPNDTIIRAGAPGDCMYFLSSGTVLVTTPSGKEVCHLTDGAYFGEIALVSKETKRTANVMALEICETYRLDKKVFKMSIRKYPDCVKVIQTLAEMRHQETNALEELRKEELFHKTYIGENEVLESSHRK